jgi:hypothetical protein
MSASGSEISSVKIALLGGGLENRPTFHRLFLAKNTGVSESLRTTYQLQTLILVGKDKSQPNSGIGKGNRWSPAAILTQGL